MAIGLPLAIGLKNAEQVREIRRQQSEIDELHKRLEVKNVSLRAEVRSASQLGEIIGSSVALQRVLALVEKVAPTDVSVLDGIADLPMQVQVKLLCVLQ